MSIAGSSTSSREGCCRSSISPATRASASGARALSTPDRLRVASTAGTLDGKAAQTLAEAFDLFWRLRLEHQVEQLRHGVEPDDYLDPETLNPLTRRYLRDAFHAVRTVQRSLANLHRLP